MSLLIDHYLNWRLKTPLARAVKRVIYFKILGRVRDGSPDMETAIGKATVSRATLLAERKKTQYRKGSL